MGGSPTRRDFGREAEEAVARWVRARGLEVVARNWRRRFGELDLVLRDGATWVAAEVRARRTASAGTPAESVTAEKRRRLVRLARAFAAERGLLEAMWRFDVFCVTPDDAHGLAVEWIPGAFSADGLG
ncbi:MAG: YraN family protein [Clostridia bacterium]|nr:YraN family protein [Clostridia bacterium]